MEYKKDFKKAFERLTLCYNRHQVFSDFVHLSVLEISQVARMNFGWSKDPDDEAAYMKIVSRYKPDEVRGPIVDMFNQMYTGITVEGGDWLGSLVGEMELLNSAMGQFFTPYDVSRLMAELIYSDPDVIRKEIDGSGWVSLNEPACGAGCMVIASADVFRNRGFNVQTELFTNAQDISSDAASMCYVQLSLMNIPALVLNMDSLWPNKGIIWGRYTPAYFSNLWPMKIEKKKKQSANSESLKELPPAKPVKRLTLLNTEKSDVVQLTFFGDTV